MLFDSTYMITVHIQDREDVHVHNTTIERSAFGIHTTVQNSVSCKNIKLDHLTIKKVLTGVQFNDVTGGSISDSYISSDCNLLLDGNDGKGNHCIYAGKSVNNCLFSGLTLENAGRGSAINRNDSDGIRSSENLFFSDITVKNCYTAIILGYKTSNVTIKNFVGTDIMRAFSLNNNKNVSISNCSFVGNDTNNDAILGTVNTSLDISETSTSQKVKFSDCKFTSKSIWIYVNPNKVTTGDDITFNNCRFVVENPQVTYGGTPVYAKGVISNMMFNGCTFETYGFSTAGHENNGVFFFLSSDRATKMQWSFDKCRFLNNGSITVNSPILSNSANDGLNTVYCSLTNCLLKGFRWTIRVATTANTSSSTLNPAFSGYPSELAASAAISALNAKKRFLSHNNIYTYDTLTSGVNDTYYNYAEEYGE